MVKVYKGVQETDKWHQPLILIILKISFLLLTLGGGVLVGGSHIIMEVINRKVLEKLSTSSPF